MCWESCYMKRHSERDGVHSTDEMIQHCCFHWIKSHSVNILWSIKIYKGVRDASGMILLQESPKCSHKNLKWVNLRSLERVGWVSGKRNMEGILEKATLKLSFIQNKRTRFSCKSYRERVGWRIQGEEKIVNRTLEMGKMRM